MENLSKEKQIEQLENDITECYGCDPMYYGTDGNYLAKELVKMGWRKQREGEWIERIEKPDWLEDDVDVFYECSVCETKSPAPTNYCPNCGSHMKGESNDRK